MIRNTAFYNKQTRTPYNTHAGIVYARKDETLFDNDIRDLAQARRVVSYWKGDPLSNSHPWRIMCIVRVKEWKTIDKRE